jgi:hypothetical protein
VDSGHIVGGSRVDFILCNMVPCSIQKLLPSGCKWSITKKLERTQQCNKLYMLLSG